MLKILMKDFQYFQQEFNRLKLSFYDLILNTPPPLHIGFIVSICPCVWTINPGPLNCLQPNLVWWCIIIRQSVCRKIDVLTSRPWWQWGFAGSKYNCVYFDFQTADPFTTKFCVLVHCHKPQCHVRKLDCWVSISRSYRRFQMSIFWASIS